MGRHDLGGGLATAIQGAFVVSQAGISPGRFGVPPQKDGFHRRIPEKASGNNCLVNCHDTVMQ
jgi:hypothetical protein